MTAGEKILAGIMQEAEQTADGMKQKAKAEAEAVLEQADRDAAALEAQLTDAAEKQAVLLASTGESGAALLVRDAILSCRRECIDAVLAQAVRALNELSDADYFAYLTRLFDKVCTQNGGVLQLNDVDLKRDTTAFVAHLAEKGATLDSRPADITGGFLLKYGDVEIDADFAALLHEKRDALVDAANQSLFA